MAMHIALSLCVYLLFTQGAEGNIDDFDCVDIYKQPAFQHPLLKNHKIQTKFSSDGKFKRNNTLYITKESCPEGTVAILKQRNGSESIHPNTDEYPGQHFAAIETVLDGSMYRGAKAEISINSLDLKNNQYSKSQIWLENGPRSELNSIQVGWAVHPRLYGDSATRVTIYWTADGYKKTGCYNTKCPGFVVVTPNPALGADFAKTSIYGKATYYSTPQIFQDAFSGNWVLKIRDEVIGYWPKQLFTHLNKGASLVRYGGNTFLSPDGISPPMGNGHFPVIDFKKSAYFSQVKIRKSNFEVIDVDYNKLRRYDDFYSCYRIEVWGYLKSTGVSFSFGGPGGNCGT